MTAYHSTPIMLLAALMIAASCARDKTDTKPPTETKEDPQPASKKEPPTKPLSAGVTQKKPAGEAAAAPQNFAVKLETPKGDIVIDVHREWAPIGADRFHELVTGGYFKDVAFFRVIAGFMAQTGISGDPSVNSTWRSKRIKDDPVKQSNTEGMVTFATSGPNSRTTQFFINFGDNSRLDRMGFAPFGKVRDMKPVNALYAGYGEGAPRGKGPSQGRIQREGNAYLKKDFPELDYITRATILKE